MSVIDEPISCETICRERRVARTRKPCDMCEVDIEPGQVYTRLVQKIEGEIQVTRFHSCGKGCVRACE